MDGVGLRKQRIKSVSLYIGIIGTIVAEIHPINDNDIGKRLLIRPEFTYH